MARPGDKDQLSEEEILVQLFVHLAPAIPAGELGEKLGITRSGAYQRLQRLEEKQLVTSYKTASIRLYWLTTEGRRKAVESIEVG